MTNKELVIKAIEIINEVYGQKIISYNGLQEISGNPNYIGGEFTIKGKTVDLGFNENWFNVDYPNTNLVCLEDLVFEDWMSDEQKILFRLLKYFRSKLNYKN